MIGTTLMAYSKKTKEKIATYEAQLAEKDKEIAKLKDEYQDLNIKFKYTEFDVEATKREILYIKRLLEDKE